MLINDLPVELLEVVFSNMWSTDLAECQLVCRRWNQAVGLKHLRRVNFNTEKSLLQFIRFIQNCRFSFSSFSHTSLIRCIHFNILQVSSISCFLREVQILFRYCDHVQFISSNKIVDSRILQALSSLSENTQLKQLKSIPITDDDIYYSLCARKFHQSLAELDLRDHETNQELVLNHEFPNLKRLTLGNKPPYQPIETLHSVLNISTRLVYLKFDLTRMPAFTSFVSGKEYPSLRELEISSKVNSRLNFVGFNRFLFSFTHLDKLTLNLSDTTVNDQRSSDPQLLAFRDFMAWINELSLCRLCINSFQAENLLPYLKLFFTTIPSRKQDWKNRLIFLHSVYHASPVISYSTHTGHNERTFGITLDNYFAKNFICNYLSRLRLPYSLYEQ